MGLGLLFIKKTLNNLFPSTDSNHNTIHLLAASAMPCDWDTSGSGRKERIRVACVCTLHSPHGDTNRNKIKSHLLVYESKMSVKHNISLNCQNTRNINALQFNSGCLLYYQLLNGFKHLAATFTLILFSKSGSILQGQYHLCGIQLFYFIGSTSLQITLSNSFKGAANKNAANPTNQTEIGKIN